MQPGSKVLAGEVAELLYARTPIVYLVTADEERAVAVCRLAAGALKAQLSIWSSGTGLVPSAPEAREPLALFESIRQGPSPSVSVLLDFQDCWSDALVMRRLRDLLPGFNKEGRFLVVVGSQFHLPAGIANDTAVLRLPFPDRTELSALLSTLSKTAFPASIQHRAATSASGLSYAQARRAFIRAIRKDPALGPKGIELVLAEKRRILAQDLSLEYVDSEETMESVGGLESFKKWVDERAQAFSPEARKYGLSEPRGVMLLGVQGCGKSLSAKSVARRFGVPLLRLDFARISGGQTGSADDKLATALAAAESIAPAVLWADEIEKAFAGTTGSDGRDSGAFRLLGSFSTWLQEHKQPVFVVATANDVTRLPPELLRRGRFDELFFVDLPDRQSRREILAHHLRRRGRDPELFELEALAEQCPNYSGAELEQIVIGALHRAFAQKRNLAPADLRRVARDIVPLSTTYEEQIKALREWATGRTRNAGREAAVVDLFRHAAPRTKSSAAGS
jgi:AAA+ superfamily predicted ATPase